MAHDRSGIATIDGAEEQRVEVRGPGYVWAAAVAAAVVAALLLVALAAAGAVDFLRRDGRQDQTALALQGESASTSSDSLDTFMEGGLVVDGEGGALGADGRGADAAGALAKASGHGRRVGGAAVCRCGSGGAAVRRSPVGRNAGPAARHATIAWKAPPEIRRDSSAVV